MKPFLTVRNLKMFYRVGSQEVRAVDDVSFEIEEPGQSLAVVGESGCGKTSLALALQRLPTQNCSRMSGEIWLEGENISKLSESELRRRIRWKKIAWVPQGAVGMVFNPVFKVRSQIQEILEVHGAKDAKGKTQELLEMVGLPQDAANQYPHQLSGGMKQRACIAKALALRSPLVILDEPTSALDVSLQGQIIQLLEELKRDFHLSYLFITHNIALAANLCEFFAVIYAGKIVERGKTNQVRADPLHPYTKRLLACVPSLEADRGIDFIPGEPPDLKNPPSGCRFHPRCPIAEQGLCEVTEPALEEKKIGHLAACHLVEKRPA